MNIGGRIKALRKAKQLTQEGFASRLGITKGFLSNLENNIRQPSEQLIKLICYEYSSSEYWLLTGEGEMFVSAEEVIKSTISRIGERAFFEGLKKILAQQNDDLAALSPHLIREYPDAELERIISFFLELWSVGDEKLKAWAEVQFDLSFPIYSIKEIQKLRADGQMRSLNR